LGYYYLLPQPIYNMFTTRLVVGNFVRHAIAQVILERPQGYVDSYYSKQGRNSITEARRNMKKSQSPTLYAEDQQKSVEIVKISS
jgi:hypothetical protein